jgi:hypothetical protein
LVALNLEEIVAASFHDEAGELALAVERIGGDAFAVQGQRLGQVAGLLLQPLSQALGKGFGAQAPEHLVENAVAGRLVEGAGALLERQPQPAALGLGEGCGETGQLGDVPPSGQISTRGSSRVRQVCLACSCCGGWLACKYLRAIRRLIPAFMALFVTFPVA